MNNIYLFDVDGTLALGDVIPNSAIEALKELRNNGDIVMLSTGRCLGQMEELLSIIKIDGAICNNGAYAFINDDVIFESPIDKKIIKQMMDDGLHATFLAKDAYFRIDENPIYKDFASRFNIKCAVLKDIKYLDNKIYSLGVQDYDLSFDMDKYNLHYVKVCDLGYDVMNNGVNKSTPIKYIKKKYPNYKIIAFGDNLNDIEMLKEADISIAMGQAPKAVKDIVNYVTLPPLDDGIKYAIDNYLR